MEQEFVFVVVGQNHFWFKDIVLQVCGVYTHEERAKHCKYMATEMFETVTIFKRKIIKGA